MPELVDLSPVTSRLHAIESRVHDVQIAIPPMVQALSVLGGQVRSIDGQVQTLLVRQDETRQLLTTFQSEFKEYVEYYVRRSELQLAETRVVKVRQELEQRFGHYDEVRRRVTGILQATDASIVRQETIRTVAEEPMLAAPRYWLAPTLVALMGWIVDQRDLAEKAVEEALPRDESKVALFFVLACRRAGRWDAMTRWLERYLSLLDPRSIDRELVVLLEATATGTLGRSAQELFWQISQRWMQDLQRVPGHAEELGRRWTEALESERGAVLPEEMKLLRATSPTWPALETALADARRNLRVVERFQRIFDVPTAVPAGLSAAVDELLDTLVSRFDDEELPLRREERRLQLIIDAEGDCAAAESRMEVEAAALAEKISFAQRLTDVLIFPEQAGATPVAQRFAALLSRDWILAAHRALVGRDQKTVPPEIELALGAWRGASTDGRNGQELAASLRVHFAKATQEALAAISLGAPAWIALGSTGLTGILWGAGQVSVSFLLVMLALAAGIFLWARWSREKKRAAKAADLARERDESLQTVEACLQEVVVYRQAWSAAHGQESEVERLLRSLTLSAVLYRGPEEDPAALLPDGAVDLDDDEGGHFRGSRLAAGVAAWDLLPPLFVVRATSALH